jgi:hypothetical protein
MTKTPTITIKKGQLNLIVPREELIEVNETADGVCFNFKGGLTLMQVEQFMQSHTKQLIKNTVDNFPGTNLIVDLNEPNKPISVDAT